MYYVNKTNREISGFGIVDIIEGVPNVIDIILLKQENGYSETELDGDAIADAEYQHYKSGNPGEIKFWWHSHNTMDVFWSVTDHAAMDTLCEHGWFMHGVFNHKAESKIAYTSNAPFSTFIDDIELVIQDDADLDVDNQQMLDNFETLLDEKRTEFKDILEKKEEFKAELFEKVKEDQRDTDK